jgi:hypothetical protein
MTRIDRTMLRRSIREGLDSRKPRGCMGAVTEWCQPTGLCGVRASDHSFATAPLSKLTEEDSMYGIRGLISTPWSAAATPCPENFTGAHATQLRSHHWNRAKALLAGSDRRQMRPPPERLSIMPPAKDAIVANLLKSFETAKMGDRPYRHWFLENCFPTEVAAEALALPFPAPALDGISGKREVHNATRKYFDAENMAKFPVCAHVNAALQDPRVTTAIERVFTTKLKGTFLRVEYAQDTDGFWLEPHTDLGVKSFTFLLYLSTDASHSGLGTDIYDTEKKHVGTSPFKSNGAMIFVPSNITYHGFEPRKIEGIRKSIIINYVTHEWRAREQLAFPDQPIA